MDFDTAQAILSVHAQSLESEEVPLEKAAGRVLAEPVIARIDAPRWDCAAMDGYAVRSADLDHGLPLRVTGIRHAGAPAGGRIAPGEAMRVMTGAPLPVGADRVVVIERCECEGDKVRLHVRSGERCHVRRRGSDFVAGTVLLPRGTMLDPCALVAAAAADTATVQARRRPRVRILATGDEIVAPGSARAIPHTIPDSLSIAVAAMARQQGAKVLAATRIPDVAAEIRAAARAARDDSDVLVIAGGASRGDRDHCRSALAALGMELAFADLAIRPGKPVWFGRLGNLAVLGLPGNPAAALTIARLFLAPLLRGLGGHPEGRALAWESRPLAASIPPNGDREAFLCASAGGGGVRLLGRQSASGQALLARTHLLMRRAPFDPALHEGTPVRVLPLGA